MDVPVSYYTLMAQYLELQKRNEELEKECEQLRQFAQMAIEPVLVVSRMATQ
mgnify:CR=1 FL=1